MRLPRRGFDTEIYAKERDIKGREFESRQIENGVYLRNKLIEISVVEDLIKDVVEGNKDRHLNEKGETPGCRIDAVLFIKIQLCLLQLLFIVFVLGVQDIEVGLQVRHFPRTFHLRLHERVEEQANCDRHADNRESQWPGHMEPLKKLVECKQYIHDRPDE